MSTGRYYVGDAAVLEMIWSDPTSTIAPVDPNTGFTMVNPSSVTCVVRKPDGTEISLGVSVDPTNGYRYVARTPTFDVPGGWTYGWTASGSFTGYRPGVLNVWKAQT